MQSLTESVPAKLSKTSAMRDELYGLRATPQRRSGPQQNSKQMHLRRCSGESLIGRVVLLSIADKAGNTYEDTSNIVRIARSITVTEPMMTETTKYVY